MSIFKQIWLNMPFVAFKFQTCQIIKHGKIISSSKTKRLHILRDNIKHNTDIGTGTGMGMILPHR